MEGSPVEIALAPQSNSSSRQLALLKRAGSSAQIRTAGSSNNDIDKMLGDHAKKGYCSCAISFSVLLSILVLTAMIVPVCVTVILTTIGGNALVNAETRESNNNVAIGVANIIDERLLIAENLAIAHSRKFSLGVFSVADIPLLMRGTMAEVETFARCSSIWLTTPTGNLYGVVVNTNGNVSYWTTTPNNGTTCEFPVDSNGNIIGPSAWCITPYLGDTKTWYTIVDAAVPGDCRWTPIYTSHDVYISFSVTTFRGSALVGVAGIDWILGGIKQLLYDTHVNGIGIILERDSEIFLAATDPKLIYGRFDPVTGNAILENVTEVQNDIVHAADRAAHMQFGSWAAADSTFWANGGIVVSTRQINRENLHWVIVAIAKPEIISVQWPTIGVSLGITGILIVISLVFSFVIMQPLRSLNAEMAAISRLDFSSHGSGQSSFLREIREMQRSFLRLKAGTKALTKYIAPPVVLEIMKSETGNVSLSLQTRPVTVMFADIRNFSTIAANMPPDVLLKTTESWFREISTVIERNGGTIDKYIGDTVIGLFDEPVRLVNPQFAACRAALGFARAMERVNSVVVTHGFKALDYRTGIHSGPCHVGHLGYSEHVNYSVSGSAVDIARQVEQLGKVYKVSPLISGDLFRSVKDECVCVPIDVVMLRPPAKVRPLRLYHLLSLREGAPPVDAVIADMFEAIHAALAEGHRDDALSQIDKALELPTLKLYTAALEVLRRGAVAGERLPSLYAHSMAAALTEQPSLGGASSGSATGSQHLLQLPGGLLAQSSESARDEMAPREVIRTTFVV